MVLPWDGALFGLEVADRRGIDSLTNDESDGIPAPVDSFVYLLPPSHVAAVSTLELDPPPRTLLRAMAMWSVVPAIGALARPRKKKEPDALAPGSL